VVSPARGAGRTAHHNSAYTHHTRAFPLPCTKLKFLFCALTRSDDAWATEHGTRTRTCTHVALAWRTIVRRGRHSAAGTARTRGWHELRWRGGAALRCNAARLPLLPSHGDLRQFSCRHLLAFRVALLPSSASAGGSARWRRARRAHVSHARGGTLYQATAACA